MVPGSILGGPIGEGDEALQSAMPTDPPYVPNEACIVCSDVFDRHLPALVARLGSAKDRDPELPESEYDGIWQVTWGVHDHAAEVWGKGPGYAKLITLSEVKMLEPFPSLS